MTVARVAPEEYRWTGNPGKGERMTEYTEKELRQIARDLAQGVTKKTGCKVRLVSWTLHLGNGSTATPCIVARLEPATDLVHVAAELLTQSCAI